VTLENLQNLLCLLFGVLLGLGLGTWRTWAYARKLLHFGISLDAWSDYSETQQQAHGAAERRTIDEQPRTPLPLPLTSRERPAIVPPHSERLRS